MIKNDIIFHRRTCSYLENYHNNSFFKSGKFLFVALFLWINVFQLLSFIGSRDNFWNGLLTVVLVGFAYNYFLDFVDFVDQKFCKFQIKRNKYTKEIQNSLLGEEFSNFLSDPDTKEKIFHTQNFLLFSAYCELEKCLEALKSAKSFAYAFLLLEFLKILFLYFPGVLSVYSQKLPLLFILFEVCVVWLCISLILLPGKKSFEAVNKNKIGVNFTS